MNTRLSLSAVATIRGGLMVAAVAAVSIHGSAVYAVTADNVVCNGCVNPSDLAAGAVTGAKIADDAVGSSDVAAESLTHNDILDEPGIDMINHSSNGSYLALSPSLWGAQQQINITHPGPGWVLCTAQGTLVWNTNSAADPLAYVGWTDSSANNVAPPGYSEAKAVGSAKLGLRMPISAMRTFLVVGSGTKTFYLRAKLLGANNGDIGYYAQSAACVYFPTQL